MIKKIALFILLAVICAMATGCGCFVDYFAYVPDKSGNTVHKKMVIWKDTSTFVCPPNNIILEDAQGRQYNVDTRKEAIIFSDKKIEKFEMQLKQKTHLKTKK